ncbi:MAG: hypothetical protein RLZZ210_1112 [Pseudomonadota bacterium]|jgi:hypothetical protein
MNYKKIKSYKFYKFLISYTILCCGIFVPYSAHAVVFSAIIAFYKILLGESYALAISIKQAAVSANRIVTMANQANKTLSESINVIEQSQRIAKTLVNYGMQTGQPLSTQCISLNKSKEVLLRKELSEVNNFIDMQKYSASITADAKIDENQTSISIHDTYCSKEEKSAGLCKVVDKDLENKDINIANTLNKDNLDKEQAQIAKAYTQKIIKPKIDINSQCNTIDCKASSSAELQYNAFLSMASYSLNSQINQKMINEDDDKKNK